MELSPKNADIIKKAQEKLENLHREKEQDFRNGRHADDHRVATEIADQLFLIGKIRKSEIFQYDQAVLRQKQSKENIDELEKLAADFLAELSIATNLDVNQIP